MVVKSRLPDLAEKVGIRLGITFAKIPLTPNAWTVLALVPALLGFYALLVGRMDFALALFAASAAIDAIDGGVARVTGQVTRLGAYLDGMVDRAVEGLLLFGLLFFGLPDFTLGGVATPAWFWLVLLLFVGSVMVSYARAYADHRKVITDRQKLSQMHGVLERAERLVLVFAGMGLYFVQPVYLTYAIVAAALLSCITLLQRVWFVVRNAEG